VASEDKAPALQWYPKQYLGDDKVLAMDWDARGMHHWLLNISWQQEPKGSLPNDMALIRRWLGSPSDDVWRRVKPQIFNAWSLRDERWFNNGMVRTSDRQKVFSESRTKSLRKRYEKSTKAHEDEVVDSSSEDLKTKNKSSPEKPTTQDCARAFCEENFLAGLSIRDVAEVAIKAIASDEECDFDRAKDLLNERFMDFRLDQNAYKGSESNWFRYGKYRRVKPPPKANPWEEWEREHEQLERERRERKARERSN
jgi:hypothetical protein